MDNDDQQVGRILSRREVLTLLGIGGAGMLVGYAAQQPGLIPVSSAADAAQKLYLPLTVAGGTNAATVTPTLTPTGTTTATVTTATPTSSASSTPTTMTTVLTTPTAIPACVVRPEVTEGPYFVDEKINRSDIRSDTSTGTVKAGALFVLTYRVSQISGSSCTPLAGAMVDVWHCDAAGSYSDVSDMGFNTVGQNFLRGYQVTDANGLAQFTTIYPGWYSGRAVHIHFKIRTTTAASQGYEFTSQHFFDDALSDKVFIQAPYACKGTRNTLNSNDTIYKSQLLLTVTETAQGYAATFDIGLDLSDTSVGSPD